MRTWPRHTDGHSLARNQRSKHNLKTRASSIKIGRREEKREAGADGDESRHSRTTSRQRAVGPPCPVRALPPSICRQIVWGQGQDSVWFYPVNSYPPPPERPAAAPAPTCCEEQVQQRPADRYTRGCTLVRAGSVQLRTAPPSHALLH